MMTEIGLAQRRLLEDDPSSAGQQLPSTAIQFSMQSAYAPFPTGSSFHPAPGQLESDSLAYIGAPNETHSNANQSLLSSRQGIYDLTPNTSNSMVSPPKNFPHDVAEIPRFQEQENPTSVPTQIIAESNAYEPDFYSPHDTEPISSVVSMRLNELKSDTTGTSLISPQHSQTSAPDELSLPVPVPVVAPVPKKNKNRGRPKKESIPDSDEEDELAFPRNHEFEQPSANGAIHPSESEETTEHDTPAPGGVSDEANEEDLEPVVKPGKSEPKEPKKKKAKKDKTAPAPQPGPGHDDEVIWVDSKPIEAEPIRNVTNPEPTALDSNPPKNPKTAQTPAKENTPQPVQDDQPGPKRRGRKRKKPAEQTPADSPAPEPVESHTNIETPAPKVSVVVDNSPCSVPARNSDDKHTPEIQDQHQDPQPQALANPEPHPTAKETPQTPSKPPTKTVETPQNQNQNSGKGPSKHSPISVRSAVPLRVGLSKRARIAPLLKMVRK
jgi:hypothetical protein